MNLAAPGASAPDAVYEARVAQFRTLETACARRGDGLSHARIVAFVLFLAAGLYAERAPGPVGAAAVVTTIAIFVALVIVHRRTRERQSWYGDLATLNEEGRHRMARDWDRLPMHTPSRDVGTHPYAADLDLFGRASITQVLGPVNSAAGRTALDGWLLARAAPEAVAARQQCVRELAARIDLRDTVALHARRTRQASTADVERFLTWAGSGGWLHTSTVATAAAWLIPLCTLLLGAAHAVGLTDRAWWILPLLAGLAVYFTIGVRVRATFDEAFGREAVFRHYPSMIAAVTGATFEAPMLRDIRERLVQDGAAADAQLKHLGRLMHLADLRLSSLHLPVFVLTMWDLHVLRALERWQRRAGPAARGWMSALGEFEALCALAALAHDQPDWCFATIDPAADTLTAVAIGHPLLADSARVTNDVAAGPSGTFLLVTGSNMSGKSTLLRSLGTNVVLAQAGGPSCAQSLVMPPLDVYTSIRVQDSLARGVSYFMAELQRLKLIVDAADRAASAPEGAGAARARLLFLLDEILHGTNTAERRIAATRVIRHLVDTGAFGAVTTHDLELAEEPLLVPHAHLVHFQEVFTGTADPRDTTLHFDYTLREGIATSTNALKLMRIVGLDPDEYNDPLEAH